VTVKCIADGVLYLVNFFQFSAFSVMPDLTCKALACGVEDHRSEDKQKQ
jgi:hypothetical protein